MDNVNMNGSVYFSPAAIFHAAVSHLSFVVVPVLPSLLVRFLRCIHFQVT